MSQLLLSPPLDGFCDAANKGTERSGNAREGGQKLTQPFFEFYSYNRYLAVAARVVRRSLKDDKRLVAERRGQQDLRFAKWTVSGIRPWRKWTRPTIGTPGTDQRPSTIDRYRTASRASSRTWLKPMPKRLSRALRPVVPPKLRNDDGLRGRQRGVGRNGV